MCKCKGSGVEFVEIFTGGYLLLPCHCLDGGEKRREFEQNLGPALKEMLDAVREPRNVS